MVISVGGIRGAGLVCHEQRCNFRVWKQTGRWAQQRQAASRASRASHGCSYLSIRVLPGPNCALDVTNAGGWPSHKGSASVNDGLAATTACNLLAVHDDAGGTNKARGC